MRRQGMTNKKKNTKIKTITDSATNYDKEWKFWLSGVATLITGVFGTIGNTISLLVLCKRWACSLQKVNSAQNCKHGSTKYQISCPKNNCNLSGRCTSCPNNQQFSPREMHSVFNHLLAALCIADLLFIGGNLALTPIALGKPEVFNPGKSTQIPENTWYPNTILALTPIALVLKQVCVCICFKNNPSSVQEQPSH